MVCTLLSNSIRVGEIPGETMKFQEEVRTPKFLPSSGCLWHALFLSYVCTYSTYYTRYLIIIIWYVGTHRRSADLILQT